MEEQIPIIYFLGSSPGKYQPIIPTFVGIPAVSAHGSP
jgi:hypothetical protein